MCFEPAFWFNSTAFAGLTAQKILLVKPLFLRVLIIAFISTLLSAVVNEIPSFLNEDTNLETQFGLEALFWLRGVRQPPKEVFIVTMDEDSDKEYQIGANPIKWRDKHAGLIQELKRQEVALIVFDLYFGASQSYDSILANAMSEAGNVLAGECLQTNESGWGECGEPPGQTLPKHSPIQIINYPTPKLAKSMLDHGLFYLASSGGDNVIRQSWTFLNSPIDRPTLPVLSWFHYLYQKGSLQKIVQPSIPLSDWLSEKRRNCRTNANESTKNTPSKSNLESRINDLICQGNSRYLDFYGPPKTFRMESYSAVREGRVTDLKNKIVFVGKVPVNNPSQNDSFNTPTTHKNGSLMVGVEVMATFLANLLEDREIKHPLPTVLVMVIFGVIVSYLVTKFPGLRGISVSFIFSAAYTWMAVWCFKDSAMLLPIAVPLLLQQPITCFISLYWLGLDLKKRNEQLTAENSSLLKKYLEQAQEEKSFSFCLSEEGIPATQEFDGVCLATDIEGFTPFSQKTESKELFEILRLYYKAIGAVVSSHGGKIVNIAGDGMIAIWVDSSIPNQQLEACLATIKIEKEVEKLNAPFDRNKLRTRIGLHKGKFTVGILLSHLKDENCIGDTINTASRIEGVNKVLGTKILASASIISYSSTVTYRPVGTFILKGKEDEPIDLIEIIGIQSEVDKNKKTLCKKFSKGIKAFRKGQWGIAQTIFSALAKTHGGDGPTKYYLDKTKAYQENPPTDWKGY